MLFPWSKTRRRRQLLTQPLPPHWKRTIEQNVRHDRFLPPAQQSKLLDLSRIVAAEKSWIGTGDFAVTDEMKITIAASASLLLLGFEPGYYFDGVSTIVVRPTVYAPPRFEQEQTSFLVSDEPSHFGQAWYDGRIVLAWDQVLAAGRDAAAGDNLVLHEFAHHLDGLDGEMGGTPPLATKAQRKTWYRVTEEEYTRLRGSARRGEATLLDHYGATNRAEFFAVSTECFFERPRAMHRRHPQLYQVLADFYKQDPARWLPDAHADDEDSRRSGTGSRKQALHDEQAEPPRPARQRELPLVMEGPDGYFTRGLEYLKHRAYRRAWQDFERVLQQSPDDAEALRHRAEASLGMGRFPEAIADSDRAIALDPDELEAYVVRGAAQVELFEFEKALADLNRVLARDRQNGEAYFERGRAYAGLNKLRRAVRDFSSALALDPYDAEALYHRSVAWEMLGKRQRAEADLARALRLDPEVARD